MNAEALIREYGYLAVFIGTMCEGETAMLLGSLAARLGYLEARWVLLCACGGAMLSDQFFFHLGRLRGNWLLERFPRMRTRMDRVLALAHRNQILMSVGFRFLYGFRVVTPLLLGSSGVRAWRFSLLNLSGCILWTGLFGLLGYMFGEAAVRQLRHIKHHELDLALALLAAGALWHLILRVRARRAAERLARTEAGGGTP